MPSVLIQIADAIVQELAEHQGELSLPYVPERVYDAERELEELDVFRVDVVPGDKKTEASGRTGRLGTFRIDIAFRRRVDPASQKDELDALTAFVEEVERFFADPPRRLAYCPAAAFASPAELRYPYLPLHLRGKNQFTSILRLTYKAPV